MASCGDCGDEISPRPGRPPKLCDSCRGIGVDPEEMARRARDAAERADNSPEAWARAWRDQYDELLFELTGHRLPPSARWMPFDEPELIPSNS